MKIRQKLLILLQESKLKRVKKYSYIDTYKKKTNRGENLYLPFKLLTLIKLEFQQNKHLLLFHYSLI